MSKYYKLNEDKSISPCSIGECAKQLFDKYKHVAREIVNDKYIFTVFLAFDHNLLGNKPLLFETMVFDTPDSFDDIYMDRYSTWEEAIEGHQKACAWVKDGCREDGNESQ